MNHKEPESRKTGDAEIITVVLIAARYFAGNIEKSICFVRSTGLMPDMLGKSRFNRRLHNIGEFLSQLFFYTGQAIKDMNLETTYSIDSFLLTISSCEQNKLTVHSSKQNLIFNRLASTWDEGTPLGNAIVGSLVWQNDSNLRFSLDRVDLWD